MSDSPTTWSQVRAAFTGLSVLGKASVACALLALALLIGPMWDFGAALVGPRPAIPAVEEEAAAKTGDRAAAFEGYVAQINGRNLFFNPRTFTQPAVAVSEEPAVPSKPTTYGGPQITAMIFDEVWFADGKRLRVGEGDDDLRILGMNPPWAATVAWRGVEFNVELFTKHGVVLKDERAPARPSEPGAEEPVGESAAGEGVPSEAGDGGGESPTAPSPDTPKDPPQAPPTEPNNEGQSAPSSRNRA